MKTAMQELKDDILIEKNLGYITENAANRILDYINNLYLNQEKEQIIDASKHSYVAGYLDNQCKVDESMNFPEEYYNQKYNNDPTRTNSNI